VTTTKHTEEVEFRATGARQTENDLNGVGESYNNLGAAAIAAAKRVGISEDAIKKATKAFAALAPGIGAATVAWTLLQKTIEVGQVGARIADTEAALSRLGATAADLDKLRIVLRGTVSDSQIRNFNAQALALGLTQEQFTKASEVAKSAAAILGKDVGFAIESVTNGLARQNSEWLDNLGITFKATTAYENYAKANGLVAAKLTDAQRRQAFFNEFVKAGNRLIEKAPTEAQADVFDRWAADFDNLGDAAVKLFSAVTGKGLSAVDDLTGRTQALADAADPAAAKLREAGEAATEAGENLRRAQLALKASGSVTRAEAQAILDAAEADFKKSQQDLLAASKAVVDEQVSYANRFKDGWVGAFEGVQSAIQKTVKEFQDAEDQLPGFIARFGRGVADPEEAKRQADARARAAAAARARRARLAETREFFQGDGLREAVRPLLESDPEDRIFQATRQAPGEVAAAGGVPESLERDRAKARADFLASQQAQRDSALEVLSAINAQAAAYARLGVSIDGAGEKVLNVSSIMGTVGVDALASIGSALGDAAVQALFYGESFSKALGNALMAAGASAIGFAISGAAIAGVMAFIPGMQAEAAALGIAAAAAAGAGVMLAGIGKAMGGDLNTGGIGGGGAGGAAGRGSPSETAERDLMRDRRRSRNMQDQQEVTIIINNSLGGERVDRAIHRAAVRGARFDRPRRAGAM
jgi:hypothetical protein